MFLKTPLNANYSRSFAQSIFLSIVHVVKILHHCLKLPFYFRLIVHVVRTLHYCSKLLFIFIVNSSRRQDFTSLLETTWMFTRTTDGTQRFVYL